MGIGGISVGSLLIVLLIVMLLFGTKRLRSLGSDLGGAFSGFRQAVKEGEAAAEAVEPLRLEAETAAAEQVEPAQARHAS